MATTTKTSRQRSTGVFTRDRGKLLVVSAATILCVYLCYRLAQPLIPALVWAITGSVVVHPVVKWLGRWIHSPRWRAGVTVGVVAVALFAPIISLVYFAALQIGTALQGWSPADLLTRWETALADNRFLGSAWANISRNLDLPTALTQLGEQVRTWTAAIITGSVYLLFQAAVALFILFFLVRDEDRILTNVRKLSPLHTSETNRLLKRLGDTIHATVFGIVMVAIIQGTLAGFVFWVLGLPTPALWGTVMGICAMIPYLGTFVVWAPMAAFLAASGDWVRALVLIGCGVGVIAVIDNLIYPILVGNRLHQHTVITFLAIVGGVALFGGTGIVLGPVIVSLTFFLLEVWRTRTAAGRPAECA
jgi:predicted PurR-regulated permease PerM